MFADRTKVVPEDQQVRNEDYTIYEEGIYVGYRHFDTEGIEVSYPFGYGLSYTEFDYSDLDVQMSGDSLHVSLVVTNTGETAGKEAVQLYVSKINTTIDRPSQELKAFAKTDLLPGTVSDTLSMHVPVSDLRYWNEDQATWVLERGGYRIRVGASSRDIRLTKELDL